MQVSLKLLLRSANVLGCSLETLLDRKVAAAEWAQAHDVEADEQAAGQRFTRFFDMDEAVRTELRARKQAAEHAEKSVPGQPVDHEANKKRLQNLIKTLSRRI